MPRWPDRCYSSGHSTGKCTLPVTDSEEHDIDYVIHYFGICCLNLTQETRNNCVVAINFSDDKMLHVDIYSSLVIRDLTLRSAASFGSFHLIRLLYDEYIFYLVEHKVASALNESPLSVLNELRQVS